MEDNKKGTGLDTDLIGFNSKSGKESFVDPETVDPKNLDFGDSNIYDNLQSRVYQAEDRVDQGLDLMADTEDITLALAKKQSTGQKALRASKVFGYGVVAGFIDNIASYDLGNIVEMHNGKAKTYGNALTDFTKGFMKDVRKENKIYQRDPGEFSPSDEGWWFQHLGDQGYSAGLAAGMILESIAGGAAIKGLSGGAKILGAASRSKSIARLNNIKNAFGLAKKGNSAKEIILLENALSKSKLLLHGAFKGTQEAWLNGVDNYIGTKEMLREKYPDLSNEEVEKISIEAAHKGFRNELGVSILLSTLQVGALQKYNPRLGQLAEREFSFSSVVGNEYIKNGIKLLEQSAVEATEEVWQAISGKEGEYKALLNAKLIKKKTAGERYSEYFRSSELHNAAFGGALGGSMFHGMSELGNAYTKSKGVRTNADIQRDFIDNKIGELFVDYKEMGLGKDTMSSTNLRSSNANQVLAALSIDKALGSDSAFDAVTGLHNEIIDLLENGTEEDIAKFKAEKGIELSNEQLLATSKSLIEDANLMKQLNHKYENEADHRISEYLTALDFNRAVSKKSRDQSSERIIEIADRHGVPQKELNKLKLARLKIALKDKKSFEGMALIDVIEAKKAIKQRIAEIEMDINEDTSEDAVFSIPENEFQSLISEVDNHNISYAKFVMASNELDRVNNPKGHTEVIREQLKQAKTKDVKAEYESLKKNHDSVKEELFSVNSQIDYLSEQIKKEPNNQDYKKEISDLRRRKITLAKNQTSLRNQMKVKVNEGKIYSPKAKERAKIDGLTPFQKEIRSAAEKIHSKEELTPEEEKVSSEHKDLINEEIAKIESEKEQVEIDKKNAASKAYAEEQRRLKKKKEALILKEKELLAQNPNYITESEFDKAINSDKVIPSIVKKIVQNVISNQVTEREIALIGLSEKLDVNGENISWTDAIENELKRIRAEEIEKEFKELEKKYAEEEKAKQSAAEREKNLPKNNVGADVLIDGKVYKLIDEGKEGNVYYIKDGEVVLLDSDKSLKEQGIKLFTDRYKAEYIDNKVVIVNGVKYHINPDENGQVTSIQTLDKSTTIKNKKIIKAVNDILLINKIKSPEVEEEFSTFDSEKARLNDPGYKVAEDLIDDGWKPKYDKIIDKIFDGKELTELQAVEIDIYFENLIAGIEVALENMPDSVTLKTMLYQFKTLKDQVYKTKSNEEKQALKEDVNAINSKKGKIELPTESQVETNGEIDDVSKQIEIVNEEIHELFQDEKDFENAQSTNGKVIEINDYDDFPDLNSTIVTNNNSERNPAQTKAFNKQYVFNLIEASDPTSFFELVANYNKIHSLTEESLNRLQDGWNSLFSDDKVPDSKLAPILATFQTSNTFHRGGDVKIITNPTKENPAPIAPIQNPTNDDSINNSGTSLALEFFYFDKDLKKNSFYENDVDSNYDEDYSGTEISFEIGKTNNRVRSKLAGVSDPNEILEINVAYQNINIVDANGNKIGVLMNADSIKGIPDIDKLEELEFEYESQTTKDRLLKRKIDNIKKAKELMSIRKAILQGKKVNGIMKLGKINYALRDGIVATKTMGEADSNARIAVYNFKLKGYYDSEGNRISTLNPINHGDRIIEIRPFKGGHIGFDFHSLTFLSNAQKSSLNNLFRGYFFNEDKIVNDRNESTEKNIDDIFEYETFSEFINEIRKYVYTLPIQFSDEEKAMDMGLSDVAKKVLEEDENNIDERITIYTDDIKKNIYLTFKGKNGEGSYTIAMYKQKDKGGYHIEMFHDTKNGIQSKKFNKGDFLKSFQSNILDKFLMHRPDFKHHAFSSNIVTIDNGSVKTFAYDDYIREYMGTNVESVEIGGRQVTVRQFNYEVDYQIDGELVSTNTSIAKVNPSVPATEQPITPGPEVPNGPEIKTTSQITNLEDDSFPSEAPPIDPDFDESIDNKRPDIVAKKKIDKHPILGKLKDTKNETILDFIKEVSSFYMKNGIDSVDESTLPKNSDVDFDDFELSSNIVSSDFVKLSRVEQRSLTNHIEVLLSSYEGTEHDVLERVKEEIISHFTERLKEVNSILKKYDDIINSEKLSDTDKDNLRNFMSLAKNIKSKYNYTLKNTHKIVSNQIANYNKKMKGAAFSSEKELFDKHSVEKDHSKGTSEVTITQKLRPEMKKLMIGISENKLGFAGFPAYKDSDVIHNTLLSIFAAKTYWTYDEAIALLKSNESKYDWISGFVKKLEKESWKTKVQFLRAISQRETKLIYVKFEKKEGETSYKTYTVDSRNSVIARDKIKNWANNRRFRRLDAQIISQSKVLFNDIKHKVNNDIPLNRNDIKAFLQIIGINDPSPKTISSLLGGKTKGINRSVIFGNAPSSLMKGIEKYFANPKYDFNNEIPTLERLAKIEAFNSEMLVVKRILDGGKTVAGYSDSRYITDAHLSFKNDPEYRRQMLELDYTKDSIYLKMFELKDSKALEKFDLLDDGITAMIKNNITKNQKEMGFEESKRVALAKYQSSKNGQHKFTLKGKVNHEFNYSIRIIPLVTISDHGRVINQKVPAFNLRSMIGVVYDKRTNTHRMILNPKYLNNLDNPIIIKKNKDIRAVRELTWQTLIMPELNYAIKNKNRETEYKLIDDFGSIFIHFPSLNLVKQLEDDKLTIVQRLNKGEFDKGVPLSVKEKLIDSVLNIIVDEVKNDMDNDKDGYQEYSTFFNEASKAKLNPTNTLFKSTDNLPEIKGDKFKSKQIASLFEFKMNYHIAQANSMQMYVGHPSQLVKYKAKKDGLTIKPYNYNEAQLIEMTHSFKKNLNKRLKAFISPRTPIISKNDRFLSIELDDNSIISKSMNILIEMHYGVAARKKYERYVSNNKVEDIKSFIKSNYPKLYDFSNIEETDAMEYVSVERYLDILKGEGLLSEKEHDDFLAKHRAYKKLPESKKTIDKAKEVYGENFLNFVFQNKKGIYTGSSIDEKNSRLRFNFIKSSIFPLLDITTSGKELDGLRKLIESKEKETGLFVHASYSSAQKVGNVKKPLSIWDKDGRFVNPKNDHIDTSMSLLESKYFGLQLDNPFKFGKDGDQYINSTTQLIKALFADNVINIKNGFGSDNKSGKEYYEEYKQVLLDLGNEKIEKFKKELLLDSDFNVSRDGDYRINRVRSAMIVMDKLKNNLRNNGIDESELSDIDLRIKVKIPLAKGGYIRIELTSKEYERSFNRNNKGNLVKTIRSKNKSIPRLSDKWLDNHILENLDFEVPLLFQKMGKSYESVLNSIIRNDIINLKMPGTSYIVASPVGFKTKLSDKSKKAQSLVNNSAFIKTKHFKDDGLDSLVKTKNGKHKVYYADVYISPKFKDPKTGKIINLYEKRNGKYVYLNETPTGLELKKGMIDDKILEFPSTRIPTSSHKMMTIVRVAGFLPPGNADTMIVPAEFTTRKGLDFDIDKETAYSKNLYLKDNSQIVALEDEFDENFDSTDIVNQLRDKIQELKYTFNEKIKNKDLDDIEKDVDDYIEEKNDSILNELNDDNDEHAKLKEKLKSIAKEIRFYNSVTLKLKENKLIEIIENVLKHPEVQKKMNTVLSMDFAKAQSNIYGRASKLSSSLSFDEQNQIMIDNLYAGDGVALFANAYVLTGFLQSSNGTYLSSDFEFGNIIETGKAFGLYNKKQKIKGLTDKKYDAYYEKYLKNSIADEIEEYLNASVDNGTVQAIGNLGLNNRNMNNVATLSMLGYGRIAIQIKEKDYEKNKDSEFYVKYDGKYFFNTSASYLYAKASNIKRKKKGDLNSTRKKPISFEEMYNAIFNPNIELSDDFFAGIQTLEGELESIGKSFNHLMGPIAVTKKNFLGKSVFEKNLKHKEILNYIIASNEGKRSLTLYDMKESYGDIIVQDKSKERPDSSFIKFGERGNDIVYIKPSNYYSNAMIHAFSISDQLWDEFLPYNYVPFKNMLDSIADAMTSSPDKTEIYSDIIKKYKAFQMTNSDNKLFENHKASTYFDKLYGSNGDGMFFSEYINHILNIYPDISNKVKNNVFLKNLLLGIKSGKSTIEVIGNQSLTREQEQDIKDSFSDLLQEAIELPDFNGEKYNTSKLMVDLIRYDIVGNKINNRNAPSKFIPDNAFKILGINQMLRKNNVTNKSSETDKRNFNKNLRKFEIQYIAQNSDNLEELRDVTINKKDDTIDVTSYSGRLYRYMKHKNSIYVRGKNKKYHLVGDISEFSELYSHDSYLNELVDIKKSLDTGEKADFSKGEGGVYVLRDGLDADDMLKFALKNKRVKGIANLIGTDKVTLELLLDSKYVTLKIDETNTLNSSAKYKSIKGKRVIEIRRDVVNKKGIEVLIFKELMHHFTFDRMSKYWETKKGDGFGKLKKGAPDFAVKLDRVFNQIKDIVKNADLSKMSKEDAAQYEKIRKYMESGVLENDQESLIAHSFSNIFEFISEASIDSELFKFLAKIKDPEGGKGFTAKVKAIFKRFMNYVLGANMRDKSIASIVEFMYSEYGAHSDIKGVEETDSNPTITPSSNIDFKTKLKEQNLLTLTKVKSADKKAHTKAKYATKYIGYGSKDSSTGSYAEQIGKEFANTGNYDSSDIVFVSIPGRIGDPKTRKDFQDKTMKESFYAMDQGAILLFDNKEYTLDPKNTYNEGEKRFLANLVAKGYIYEDILLPNKEGTKLIKVGTARKPKVKNPTSTAVFVPKGGKEKAIAAIKAKAEKQANTKIYDTIIAFRTKGFDYMSALIEHGSIGNPFTVRDLGTGVATDRFESWLKKETDLDFQTEYRDILIKLIESGKLKGKPIMYYNDKLERNHATVLDELINRDGLTNVKEDPTRTVIDVNGGKVTVINNFIENRKEIIDNIEYSLSDDKKFKSYNKSNKSKQVAIVYGPVDYTFSTGRAMTTHPADPMPNWVKDMAREVEIKLGHPKGYFNQVLINRYANGVGIASHTDAENIYPDKNNKVGAVAIVSIGNTSEPHIIGGKKILAKSGSLAEMSTGRLRHSVGKSDGVRYSINFRHIPENQLTNVKEDIAPKETKYRYYGRFYDIILDANGIGIDVKDYKWKAVKKQKLLDKFNENNHIDPQNGDNFGHASIDKNDQSEDNPTSGKYSFTHDGISIPVDFELGEEQVHALKVSIDFILNDKSESKFMTIQGSAGTGKSTIASLLQKYMDKKKKIIFRYMSPTHAANLNLAFANLKNGIFEFPKTIQSTVYDDFNNMGMPTIVKKMKSEFYQDIYIVDEASMIEENDIKRLIAALESDSKVIFLGDPKQMPPSSGIMNSAFNKDSSVILKKVYRQNPNSLLRVLTKISNNNKLATYKVKNGDESLQYKGTSDFYESAIADFKKDPDETIILAYTNAEGKRLNTFIKKKITGTTNLVIGDKLVGHAGRIGKSPLKNSMANSINYILKDFRLNPLGGIDILAYSPKLTKLKENIGDLENVVRTKYFALSPSDSLQIEGLDYEKANESLTKRLGPLFHKLHDAVKKKDHWKRIQELREELTELTTNIDLGGNYIFDVKANKFVPLQEGFYKNRKIQEDMTFRKGVDYGYAMTVHKSQGSTIKNVYVELAGFLNYNTDVKDQSGNILNSINNALLYVALSRASNKAVIHDKNIKYDEVIDEMDIAPDLSSINIDRMVDEKIEMMKEEGLSCKTVG